MDEKESRGNKKHQRILIVDDDEKNLTLTKDLLEVAGYEVIVCEGAEIGIAVAKEKRPDLILMDFQLPGLDGIQASKILKKDETTKGIPLIFCTASVTEAEKEKFRAAGHAMIAKPINTRTFVKDIEQFLKSTEEEDKQWSKFSL